VARRCDQSHAELSGIVCRSEGRRDFQLAAIAGAGVDVAKLQRAWEALLGGCRRWPWRALGDRFRKE